MDPIKLPETVAGSTKFSPTWKIQLIWDIEQFKTVTTSESFSSTLDSGWGCIENPDLGKKLQWFLWIGSGDDFDFDPSNPFFSVVFRGDSADLIDTCMYEIIVGEPGSEKCVSKMAQRFCSMERLTPNFVDVIRSTGYNNKKERTFPCRISLGGHGCPKDREGYRMFPGRKRDKLSRPWMTSLFKNEKFSDITIKCGGVTFPAHKNVLGQSSVFEKMFATAMKEALTNEIVITDADPNVFECFLKSLYGVPFGLPANPQEILDLVNSAEKYQILPLKVSCFEKLATMLCDENAAELTIAAHRFCTEAEMSEFRDHFRKYCLNRHKGLIQNPEYKHLYVNNLEAFI